LVLVILGLTLVTYPVFFVLYRLMIFQTVPRDDYAPYLLWMVGAPGGALPGSPYIYRYLSIVLLWPIYHLLPVFHLTNIPTSVSVPYQRATAALAMLSDVSVVAATVVVFETARGLGKTALVPTLSALLVYAGCWFTQIVGIDPVTVFGVAIVVALLLRADRYFLLLIPLVFVNEKIAIVAFLFLAVRCVTGARDRTRMRVKLAISMLALLVYGMAVFAVHASGNEYQLTPSGYLGNIAMNIAVNLSLRGLLLSWAPVALVLLLALIGTEDPGGRGIFSRRDGLLVPLLVIVGLTLTEDFQVGRIVMMAIPLYAIPAAERLAQLLEAGGRPTSLGLPSRGV
jgi:hypothetical protein